ncbi:multiple sugar transport system substrate-binding protein [Halanaerobium saccharolyticum]|uniref:Multiple sugar transport system substrate-binding protein n=1 Tax=Halanaerobium saccharolyticum TaxID=43595 RepID=A0A4R7YZ41_9FIRM|nr:ABC transporter substrate-binding protein [Halanaerobium saccharolyticum]RAK06866.1 multiple sugar transport system substrate-binding protein [Halanaerobium saccharolyticum]TDW01476.1 multiple sugar transport system substrate-binding protein [Halanaerobium saccharolyticum]TDX52837.1 multiple sugar transport system substrate-binding protein [Halanaerobium saccharolyticum]
MFNKKTLALVLILTFALSLSLSVAAMAQDEEVTLRFAWWGSQSRHERTLRVIEMFEEEYPNIKIQPEYTGWSGYWDKMNAQAAGDNLPDIIQHVRKMMASYVENDQLLALDPYIEDGSLDVSKIGESYLEMGRAYGKQMSLATGVNAPAGYYDKELFDAAGVDYPSPEDTWEDRAEMLKKLHEELGILGAATPASQEEGNGFVVWLRQHGQNFYSEDGKSLGYDDDQLFVDYMNYDLELIESGAVQDAMQRQESANAIEQDPVTQGEAASATNYWSNQLVAISNGAGKLLHPFLYPSAEGQVREGRFMKPAMVMTAARTTEHPEEVMTFLNFWFNNVEAGKVIGTDRGVPTNSEIRTALKADADEYDQAVFDFIEVAAENAGPVLPLQPPADPEVTTAFADQYWEVIYGMKTPAEAAADFREEATKLLSR